MKGDAASDLASFGAPKELIETLESAANESEKFEVMKDNWESVLIFLRMTTQWNREHNVFLGLSYPSLESILNLLGVAAKRRSKIFDDIQTMELAALEILNGG